MCIRDRRYPDTIVKPDCIAVSADCEYPEIAVKWLDIFYNPDYAWIFNYGLREGESYVKDENGNLHWGCLLYTSVFYPLFEK